MTNAVEDAKKGLSFYFFFPPPHLVHEAFQAWARLIVSQ